MIWAQSASGLAFADCIELLPEKAMAPHSSTLAWKIPWMEEPGRLQSMGSLRVEHDWVTALSLFIFMHWRRKWQPSPVFLPREFQGRGSLVGCCLWAAPSRTQLKWLSGSRTSPSSAAKNIINLISPIWWCPHVGSFLMLLEEDVCYDQCILLAKLC